MKWLSEKIDLVKLQIDYEFLKINILKIIIIKGLKIN